MLSAENWEDGGFCFFLIHILTTLFFVHVQMSYINRIYIFLFSVLFSFSCSLNYHI